jgi:hypothetical protein
MSDFKRKDQSPFFKDNPDVKEQFAYFCRANLADLSTWTVDDYLAHVLFPTATTVQNAPLEGDQVFNEDDIDTIQVDLNEEETIWLEKWLKEKYKLGISPSPSTVWDCMKNLGYTYN